MTLEKTFNELEIQDELNYKITKKTFSGKFKPIFHEFQFHLLYYYSDKNYSYFDVNNVMIFLCNKCVFVRILRIMMYWNINLISISSTTEELH